MNNKTIGCVLAAAILGIAPVALAQSEKPVKVYTDGLPKNIAEQVEKAAAQGEASLKRYLEQTQKQHRLRYEDVTQPRVQPVSDTGGLAKEPKKHANEYK